MRVLKVLLIAAVLLGLAIFARLYVVQKAINNQPVEISDLAESGYTPEGVFGHGTLVLEGGPLGWHIYDIPAGDSSEGDLIVRKVCAFGGETQPHMDVDFIYLKGAWVKLRTGTMTLGDGAVDVEPLATKWKGVLKSKTSFPVRQPDFPYRLKILWGKLRYGALSPLEYLQGLKRSNLSCENMPTP